MFVRNVLQVLVLLAVLSLAGCAASQTQSSTPPEPVAEVEIIDTYEGDGMEIPINGSSLAEFEASMARIKRHTDEESYSILEGSIEYLLIYDLEANRSLEKLAAKLDGLNGYQVMEKASAWRKQPDSKSERGKTPPVVTVEA